MCYIYLFTSKTDKACLRDLLYSICFSGEATELAGLLLLSSSYKKIASHITQGRSCLYAKYANAYQNFLSLI